MQEVRGDSSQSVPDNMKVPTIIRHAVAQYQIERKKYTKLNFKSLNVGEKAHKAGPRLGRFHMGYEPVAVKFIVD